MEFSANSPTFSSLWPKIFFHLIDSAYLCIYFSVMGLIASLPEINKRRNTVFVMHEKSEKIIPLHIHNKGQLSYVEGGIAYITVKNKTYVVPARHYFWIPAGTEHVLKIGYKATVMRSLYFYANDDAKDSFYETLGIYPASELLIQMLNYTERWDGKHIAYKDPDFYFLAALKNILPQQKKNALPIIIPTTDDEEMQNIIKYLQKNISKQLSLKEVSNHFNRSERSMSRLFQTMLHISFLQFLKTIRMIKAIELILKTKKSISEVAALVGYLSVSSFSDTFQEFTKCRPSDFRKR